jgi:hypothetical protein
MPFGPVMRGGGQPDPTLPEVVAQFEARQKRDPATRAAMERSPELRASLKEVAVARAVETVRQSILNDETLSPVEKVEKLKLRLIRALALSTPSEIPMRTMAARPQLDETDKKDNT